LDEDAEREIEELLRREIGGLAPVPASDLVARTIRRVQALILVGDLLRLATFEGFWMSRERADDDAERPRERQDS
jgi:hypothetical protein